MTLKNSFYAVFCRELSRIRGQRAFWMGFTLLPIVSFAFLVFFFGDSSLHNLPLAVVDADNSTLSRRLTRMVDATAGVEVAYMPSSVEEAETLMLENKIDAVLYIPKGMERDIYTSTVVTPRLYVNAMRILNSSLVYKDVALTAQMLSAGIEMQMLTNSGKTPLEAYSLALPVYYEKHQMFNPYTSYGYYLVSPFNTLMILLYAITFTLFAFGLEHKEGTTEDLINCANGSPFVALFAKTLPYTIYYTLFSLVSNFVVFGILGTPLEGSVWMLSLNSFLVIIAYQACGLLIFAVASKLMVSMSLSAALTTMSFTMSGLTFPLMAMKPLIFYFAHLFPFTHYMFAYIDFVRGATIAHTVPYMATLLIYPVLLIILTPTIMRKLCKPYAE